MARPRPSETLFRQLIKNALNPLGNDPKVPLLLNSLHTLYGLALSPEFLLHEDADNPHEHNTTVLGYMMEICKGERMDWPTIRVAAAIALLHDIWPVRKITSEMIEDAPPEDRPRMRKEREESVPIHMIKGSENARAILNKLNEMGSVIEYDQIEIKQVCGVIAIHDNPKIGKGIPTEDSLSAAFREADRLWMQDPKGVVADLARKGNNYPTRRERAAQAQVNVKSFRKERTKSYEKFPAADFCDKDTLFRTTTGYNIFKRLRRYWEYEVIAASVS